jgi:hypothetical protein
MSTHVILRDFDGTETVYPVDGPPPKIVHTGDEDTGILITRHYLQTGEVDPEGRTIYQQSNL